MSANAAVPQRLTWFSSLFITASIRFGLFFFQQPRSDIFPSYGERVARIGPRSIIKRGRISEVETMQFLSQNTSLPIPKVWRVWTFGEGRCWFIMEYIVGDCWNALWEEMNTTEREDIMEQMKQCMRELRCLNPSFNPNESISSVCGRPSMDFRISPSENFGPFDIDAFYDHLLRKVKMIAGESKATALLQRLRSLKSHNSPLVVFTHGDLTPQNIILNNGKLAGIIDWEQAGWRPYWWEYVKALYTAHAEEEEWRTFVYELLKVYKEEEEINTEIQDIEGIPY